MEKASDIHDFSNPDLSKGYKVAADEYQVKAFLDPLLQKKDYYNLSLSLLKKGELCLLNGDISGLELFDMALKLSPSSPLLHYQQGLALFEYGTEKDDEEKLRLANKRFKTAALLSPSFFETWHTWGNTLFLLGLKTKEFHFFQSAKNKYEKAIELSNKQSPDILADLYWDYGNVWTKIAEHSEEVNDYLLALKAYETASGYQEDLTAEFWQNFGEVALSIGEKINDMRYALKAINCFKNAISIAISSGTGWYQLACALKFLYMHTHDEDHFSQANECFSSAYQVDPGNKQLLTTWAELLLYSGEMLKDTKKLRSCIEKCQKLRAHPEDSIKILTIWSRALAHLGLLNEDLKLLYESENKILEAREFEDKNPDISHAHGVCLFAFASYHQDFDYYYQAIEYFQEGLSINRSYHLLWFEMARTYVELTKLDHDEKNLEIACRFFNRVLNLKKTSSYYYHYAKTLYQLGEMRHDQTLLKDSIEHFKQALNLQKNASYVHPNYLFDYAVALDSYAQFSNDEQDYTKAIDLLSHVLMVDAQYSHIHYQIALTLAHFGELAYEPKLYERSLHHYRIAHQKEKEEAQILLDWGVTLINYAEHFQYPDEIASCYQEARHKLNDSARLGNTQAYYYLACLHSLLNQTDRALYFFEKAYRFDALPPLHEIHDEEWLDNLKYTPEFQDFLISIKSHIQD